MERADFGAHAAGRAALLVDRRHEDADLRAAPDHRVQEEVTVRLLDVGVQEPDCRPSAREHRREVRRKGRLAGAAFAAGDGDAHGLRPPSAQVRRRRSPLTHRPQPVQTPASITAVSPSVMAPRTQAATHAPQAMQDPGLATIATVRILEAAAGSPTRTAPGTDATSTLAVPETLPQARAAGPRPESRPLPSRRRRRKPWPAPRPRLPVCGPVPSLHGMSPPLELAADRPPVVMSICPYYTRASGTQHLPV